MWFLRGGGRGRERVACCRGLSPEWLRGGSWWQETQGLRWDLSAEWSMLQTIYEGESSFSTTEGRVGHQQLPNHSKMHNVNNSGDHTAWCFYVSWGISFFALFFFSSLHSNLCISFYHWICSYFSAVLDPLCLPCTHSLCPSLPLSHTQLFLLSRSLILCEKRTQNFSAQQRGRIRHFFLTQGIYSYDYIRCFINCVPTWDCYLILC